MQVVAEYTKGVQFKITSGKHEILCDQPESNGGGETGMSPPEFLLVSLAACAGYYALQYLRTRNLPADDVRVSVTAEKAAQPARLGRFGIVVETPDVEERHREGLLRAVKTCLIHNTLLHPPTIEISVQPVPDMSPAAT